MSKTWVSETWESGMMELTNGLSKEEFGEAVWELVSVMTTLQQQGREFGTVYQIIRRDWLNLIGEYEKRFGFNEFNEMWDGIRDRQDKEYQQSN